MKHDPYERLRREALQVLRPPQKLALSEWVEGHVYLPSSIAAHPGRLRLWPHQREIADSIGNPAVERVTATATAAATSGAGVKMGNLFGIASCDAAIGEPLVLVTEGVFEMPKVSTDDFTVGAAVCWRSSDGAVTTTASGNTGESRACRRG
ncbi:hypothetical protein CCR90_09785 [Rhodovulum sulfidophilum]|uniref:DUF2190 family protein n=1 Tax=Rhodovulum sulfidophilum TaxID=35806 RepID=UPI0019133D45|nr:DUF2190 family protein [Rhodovulum sulfidophilum]MBK5924057.1 hypothetical protein [Rhodovulum sulfidophilum]